ncbi:MAG: hypothetical protein Q7T54_06215 [Candidatus Levybacteria bacterium]|nr:hypothetical protein [Candidatus Levybacteria bacterium]
MVDNDISSAGNQMSPSSSIGFSYTPQDPIPKNDNEFIETLLSGSKLILLLILICFMLGLPVLGGLFIFVIPAALMLLIIDTYFLILFYSFIVGMQNKSLNRNKLVIFVITNLIITFLDGYFFHIGLFSIQLLIIAVFIGGLFYVRLKDKQALVSRISITLLWMIPLIIIINTVVFAGLGYLGFFGFMFEKKKN